MSISSMPESERLARADELNNFFMWLKTHDPSQYRQYTDQRDKELAKLADPSSLGPDRTKRLHQTRGSVLELLNTLKDIGYENQPLAMFHIDIIVYRIEAIWKARKKNAKQA